MLDGNVNLATLRQVKPLTCSKHSEGHNFAYRDPNVVLEVGGCTLQTEVPSI